MSDRSATVETDDELTTGADTGRDVTDGVRRLVTSDRLALWVFIAYLILAVPILLNIGSGRWFFGDDWTLVSERSATDLGDLFRPNNRHWNTLGILAFRPLYLLFGVKTYVPYMLLVIAGHLTTVALIRVIMRRIGIGPWIATIAAATLVLLGPANDNILWAVQITFVGSILFGLTQLLLADHDGPIDTRDWLGLLAGGLALMTSSQAPPVILATGLYLLYRRGWRPAVFQVVPLMSIYAIWYFGYDNGLEASAAKTGQPLPSMGLGDFLDWNLDAVRGLLEGLGHFSLIAIGLGLMLVAGFLVGWRTREPTEFRRGAVLCGCLVLAAAISMGLAAPGRFFFGENYAASSRYIGVMAMLCLPAFAFAADSLVRWRKVLWPVVVGLFLLPVPWNIDAFGDHVLFNESLHATNRAMVVAVADDPDSRKVPEETRPLELDWVPRVTIGWLLQAKDDDKLPRADPPPPAAASTLPVRIGVMQGPGGIPPGTRCREYDEPLALDPKKGKQYGIPTHVMISTRKGDQPAGAPVGFVSSAVSQNLTVNLPDLHLLVMAPAGASTFEFCT